MNMYVAYVRTYIYVCARVCRMHIHASVASYRRQRMIFLTDACEDMYVYCFFMYENISFFLLGRQQKKSYISFSLGKKIRIWSGICMERDRFVAHVLTDGKAYYSWQIWLKIHAYWCAYMWSETDKYWKMLGYMKSDLKIWKKHINRKRPTYITRDNVWKETQKCGKRPIYMKCDLRVGKETYIYEKRPTYLNRDLHMWTVTCVYGKRHTNVK